MKKSDNLLSDDQLEKMATDEDPTVSIQIPLRETQPITKPPVGNQSGVVQSAVIGRIKPKKRTQQLSALTSGEAPTSPIIRTNQAAPSGLTIQQIYKNAGLGTETDQGFNVFRVESMLDDTSIVELDDRAKEAAVVMALKTHDVNLESVIDDGRDHQLALEAHDLRFQDELKTKNAQLETENARLHAEIERYANPRIERMEANQKRLDELQETYVKWEESKRSETERLDKMVNRWKSGVAPTGPMMGVAPPFPIADKKPKRETEPLPLFDDSDPDFLEPVVLMSSELDSEIISLANAFPDSELEESSAVLAPITNLDPTQDSEVDLTMETLIKPSGLGNIAYYGWVLFSVVLWVFGGILWATGFETMKPVAALGLAFCIPLGIALFMGMISKGHGRWLGYIAFLGYCGLAICVIAHFDINNLAKLLSENPVWLTEASNLDGTVIVLPEALASGLTKVSNFYGEFLYSSGLASKP